MRSDRRNLALATILFVWCFLAPALYGAAGDFYQQPANVGSRFLDLRTYLFKVAGRSNLSVIIAQNVKTRVKEVKGKTVQEALNNYLANTEYSYKIQDNCIFVAERRRLAFFFEKLPEDTSILPDGKGSKVVSGIFTGIECKIFFTILSNVTGVEVRATDNIRENLVLRLIKMPWKTVVIAIARLNNYKLMCSEFSVVITRQGI
jgi:hypothetical protein